MLPAKPWKALGKGPSDLCGSKAGRFKLQTGAVQEQRWKSPQWEHSHDGCLGNSDKSSLAAYRVII